MQSGNITGFEQESYGQGGLEREREKKRKRERESEREGERKRGGENVR